MGARHPRSGGRAAGSRTCPPGTVRADGERIRAMNRALGAATLLSILAASAACTGMGGSQESAESRDELRARVIELEKKAVVAELEIDRLRQKVAALEGPAPVRPVAAPQGQPTCAAGPSRGSDARARNANHRTATDRQQRTFRQLRANDDRAARGGRTGAQFECLTRAPGRTGATAGSLGPGPSHPGSARRLRSRLRALPSGALRRIGDRLYRLSGRFCHQRPLRQCRLLDWRVPLGAFGLERGVALFPGGGRAIPDREQGS